MSTVYENAPIAARPREAMIEVAAQGEIARVQGSMAMARRFPRDVVSAIDRIKMACARPDLASVALYTYARGGTNITGPSIRMAEAIAQSWGNIRFGIREIEQRSGESTIEAFAIDLETNTEQVKVFQVPHVRFTRSGGRSALEDPRDVYEQTANQGARRLRACILGIIPGDVIETAIAQVEETLKAKVNITPEKIASMIAAFGAHGITKTQIEKRLQRRVDSITPALMIDMGKILNSLRDGMSEPGNWFEPDPIDNGGAPAPTSRTEAVKNDLKAAAPPAEVTSEADEGEEAATPASGGATAVSEPDEPLFPESNEDARIVAFRSLDSDNQAMRIRVLAEGRKMLSAEGKVDINKRAAEKWGLPVGAWQIGQLVSTGYAEKMFAMLIA